MDANFSPLSASDKISKIELNIIKSLSIGSITSKLKLCFKKKKISNGIIDATKEPLKNLSLFSPVKSKKVGAIGIYHTNRKTKVPTHYSHTPGIHLEGNWLRRVLIPGAA